jgi:hypothetical protein
MAERTKQSDQTPAESGDEVLTFPVDDLIARSSDYLGHSSHVVAGALHGRKADMSLDDARARINDFLEKPALSAKEA